MEPHPGERAGDVTRRFVLDGTPVEIRPHGNGLINDTFLVRTDSGWKGILQRINGVVFPEPERVQANLRTLLDHVGRIPAEAGRSLRWPAIVRTHEGRDWVADADGFWRLCSFVDGAVSFDVLTSESQAREVGRALGCFHTLVSDLDPWLLHDTLPGFHITPDYLLRLDEVLADHAGGFAPDAAVQTCLKFVDERRVGVGVLEDAKACGRLRLRVIHGDPKLDNVLFDAASGKALSLIDLDTVKPGLIHYDLGDCLRSCCNRVGEVGGGVCAAHFDLRICRAILAGYFAEAGATLTEQDVEFLFDAIRLIPFELGLRFLTDHLEGNVYFKVTEPGQNLLRAAVQFDLVRSIEQQEAAIRAVGECEFFGR